MNLLEILVKGGYLMIALGIVSIIGIAIIIEKFIAFRNAKTPQEFIERCKVRLQEGDRSGAISICNQKETPISRMVKAGIQSGEEIKSAMEGQAKKEVLGLESHMTGLATVVGISPLLGFLGTVTGMIKAFMQVERLGGNVNASVLAGGIWEALLTTAVGLSIAIVTYIFYNYFTGRIRVFTEEMESAASKLTEAYKAVIT
jgi:biopolymer transport protein ExbB